MKKFADELYEAGRINDYIKETIDESIANFTLLLPGRSKKKDINIDRLDSIVSLAISDINAEISELIH